MDQSTKNEPDMIIASAVCRFMGRPFNTQGHAERERRLEEARWAIKALNDAGYIVAHHSTINVEPAPIAAGHTEGTLTNDADRD